MQTLRQLITYFYNFLENSNLYLRKSILVVFDQFIIFVTLIIGLFLEGIEIKGPVLLFINFYYFFAFLLLFIYLQDNTRF